MKKLCDKIYLSMMLVTTQSISHSKLAFEAVSAMGTVGLSMGATPNLDTFGKLVIIATMFIGRVMPAMIIYYLNSKITEFADLSEFPHL